LENNKSYTMLITVLTISVLAISVLAVPSPVIAQSDEGLFKITIIAPGLANLLRQQWGLIIANSFRQVGIDARVVFLGWGAVIDRVFEPTAEMMGKTYDEGGFDAELIGWTPGLPSTAFSGTYQTYHSNNLPPGSNYFLWENDTADQYIDDFMAVGYTPEGIEAYKNWQKVQYEDVPASQIHYSTVIMSASNDLDFNGYEWLFDNVESRSLLYLQGRSEVVMATTGTLEDIFPVTSNSWYDTIVFESCYESMFEANTTFGFEPALAASYTKFDNGTWQEYTYNLRSGVQFHDGEILDADDVLFSYLVNLGCPASYFSGLISGYIGDDISFKWLNGTTTRLALNLTSGAETPQIYPATPSDLSGEGKEVTIEAVDASTVKFYGTHITATFHPEADNVDILPKHAFESIGLANMKTHTINTGVGTYESNSQTFSGPLGTGPYVFKGYDATKALCTLEKFDNYWNKAALEAQNYYQIQDYYIRYIAEKDSAIAALKNDEVQILEANYQLQRDYLAGTLDFATSYELAAAGIQQLGYNMRHPVFGTGVETPLGIQDPSRAAEAARYVRQALDYLIPRELIIQNLLSGFGDPASVHINPLSPWAEPTAIPREYDPEQAKILLAMAGYDVGVTPGGPTTLSSYMLGQPATFTGTFPVDTVAAYEEGGIVVLLQMSTDNETWTPVSQGVTTTGGYYDLSFTPQQTGTYYFRTFLTGVGALTAAQSANTGPDFMYEGLTKAVSPQNSTSVQVVVKSFDEVLAPLSSEVSDLTTQVSDLTAQVANLTTVAYGGIVVAIIAIVIAFLVGRR